MSWVPPRRPPDVKPRPWLPKSLREEGLKAESLSALSYIVVDELIGDSVGLSVARWPDADDRGRLRFDVIDGPEEVAVSRRELLRFLEKSIGSNGSGALAGDLRIGDVFAAEVKKSGAPAWPPPLSRWLGETYDVTHDARTLAKLAFYGATATKLDRKQSKAWGLDELRE
ncbi:MAG: hypothetical protein H0U16_05075 [Actinobacteria bacterium]|nr:hypothetical protein [Actinomycetota bacterium]